MTGSLPTDWWAGSDSLLRIRHLYLNDNHFSGEIPQEFTTMGFGRIDQVVLHNNQFEGTFPGGWDPVEFLQVVSIFNNKFRAIHKDICQMSVFVGGELTSLRADCDICKCGAPYCVRPRCTAR